MLLRWPRKSLPLSLVTAGYLDTKTVLCIIRSTESLSVQVWGNCPGKKNISKVTVCNVSIASSEFRNSHPFSYFLSRVHESTKSTVTMTKSNGHVPVHGVHTRRDAPCQNLVHIKHLALSKQTFYTSPQPHSIEQLNDERRSC